MSASCDVEGCPKPIRARRLCSTHYNQRHQPNRHRKVTVPCAWCEKPCATEVGRDKRYAHRFCSLDCRDTWRRYEAGALVCEVTKWHRAHPDYKPPLPVLWVAPPKPAPRPRLFVAGNCRHCDAPFVTLDFSANARYCSDVCSKKYNGRKGKERRRARERKAFVEDVDRREVFDADGYVCYLCGDDTDPHDFTWREGSDGRPAFCAGPRYPTVEHVVALSNGGAHERTNLRTAHLICNSLKSDRVIFDAA